MKGNLTKLQEQLRLEKTKVNKMVLESATIGNKLRSKEREASELNIQISNIKIEKEELQEKLYSAGSNIKSYSTNIGATLNLGDCPEELQEHIERLQEELLLLREQQEKDYDRGEDLTKVSSYEILEKENQDLVIIFIIKFSFYI